MVGVIHHGPINFCSKTNIAELNDLVLLSSGSACYWDPKVAFRWLGSNFPLCSLFREEYNAFSDIYGVSIMSRCLPHPLLRSLQKNPKIVKCDCPCDDLVEVETPPESVMAVSYIAQALVVTIVGLNMGFR